MSDIKLDQGHAKFTKFDQASRNSRHQKCAAEQDPYWVPAYIRFYRTKFSCHDFVVLGIWVPLRPRSLPSTSFKYTVAIFMIKANKMHYFSTLFGTELYMFRTDLLSIIRSLNTVLTATGICHTGYVDCLLARLRRFGQTYCPSSGVLILY